MEKKYLKYQITNTDNLNIISEKLGISITELVGFHNVHCKNNDSIGSGLPKHLTEIFVYPHIREIKKEKYPTASFEEGYVLKCKPNFKKQNFGVQYKIENNNGTTNMSFEVSLQCKQEKSGHFLYEFIKKEVYINYEETDLMADQLAEKTAHVLYPLQIIINPNGQLISIHNFATIKKRWIDTKNELKEYYVGEWSDKYLELTEKTLENEDTLFNAISNDWFLKSYFNGLYVNYTPSFKIKTTVNFPIVFEHSLNFVTEQ